MVEQADDGLRVHFFARDQLPSESSSGNRT